MRSKLESLVVHLLMGVLRSYRRSVVQFARIEAATCYVRAVRGARLGFIGLVLLCLALALLAVGFVLLHVGLFLYLPWTAHEKAWGLLICGAVYFILALAAILFLTSEKTWIRYAKVREVLDKALTPPP